MSQEVERLLQQLAAEQKEVDTLRASVFQERMDIAKETERVTSLARVSVHVLDGDVQVFSDKHILTRHLPNRLPIFPELTLRPVIGRGCEMILLNYQKTTSL